MKHIKTLLLCIALSAGAQAQDFIEHPAPGFDAMKSPEAMPLLHAAGTVTKQALAFDQSGKNNDGNYRKAFVQYVDKNGEAVIFDEYGPGCLYRQQMNVWVGYGGPTLLLFNPDVTNARIKYYFDDEPQPRFNVSMDDLFGARREPFTAPFTFQDDGTFPIPPRYDINRGRFSIMYYPLTFKKRLKITFVPEKNWDFRGTTWYQNTFLIYPKGTEVESWSNTALDCREVRKQWNNVGTDPKPTEGNRVLTQKVSVGKGQTKTLFELKGQGSIASLKLNLKPFTKETFFNTRLQMYWDGADTPAVDLPLGYFFGGGGKDYEIADDVWQKKLASLFFGYDCKTGDLYAYWPMPYWKSARVVLKNESSQSIRSLACEVQYKDASVLAYPAGKTGYFHAKCTVDTDDKTTPFTTAFHETGRGHVVGILFFTEGYDMDGDEFTYIDGSRTPQIHGSGTEDDHNQGWAGTAYQKPLWGALTNGYASAYRVYMNDNYIFNKDITINYEYSKCKGWPKGGDSDVTVFYYKAAAPDVLKLTDELDVANAASEQAHNYAISQQTSLKTVSSAYDGYEQKIDYDTLTDAGRGHCGYSEFVMKIDSKNSGVKLRKRLNRSGNGVQTVRVLVDGEDTGMWHFVQSSYAPVSQSWVEYDYEIPARYTSGKSSLRIRLEYVPSDGNNGEVNEYYYWAYCYPENW